MNRTYNQVCDIFRQFVDNHGLLKRFKASFLESFEQFSKQDKNFPVLYIVPQSTNLNVNRNEYVFRIYVVDLLNTDRTNEGDVINDTLLCVRDLIVFFNKNITSIGEITLVNNPTAYPVNAFLTDLTVGWYSDFIIEAPSFESECAIPYITPLQFTGLTCDYQTIKPFLTCETLLTCENFIALSDRVTVLENRPSGDYVTRSGDTMTGELILPELSFNTTATTTYQEGKLRWNNEDGTLNIGLKNDVELQVGQEQVYKIQNDNTYKIENGKVICYANSIGNSGNFRGEYCLINSGSTPLLILGIATEDIEIGEVGYVTEFGKIRGIQTDGAQYGETWIAGTILYASTTYLGGLTNVQPQAPNPAIPIAAVISTHATNGTLFARPTLNYRLEELINVDGTPITTTGQILVWDNTRKVFDFTNNINNYSLLSEQAWISSGGTTTLKNTTDKVLIGQTGTTIYKTEIFNDVEGTEIALRLKASSESIRPGIRIDGERLTATGYAYNFFEAYTNLKGSPSIRCATLGYYARATAVPTNNYMFLGSEINTSYTVNTLRLYPNANTWLRGKLAVGTTDAISSGYIPKQNLEIVSGGTFGFNNVNFSQTADGYFSVNTGTSQNFLGTISGVFQGAFVANKTVSVNYPIGNFVAYADNPGTESGAFVGSGMRRRVPTNGLRFYFGESIAAGTTGFLIAPVGSTMNSAATLMNVARTSDGTNSALFINGSGQVGIGTSTPSEKLEVIGTTKIGSTTSYTYFENDGTLTFNGEATVYDDFVCSLSVPAAGVAAPDIVNYTILGTPTSFYSFDGAATEERLNCNIEMYHAYKVNSDVEIHAHFMPSTTAAGVVVLYYDYFISKVNQAPIAGGTLSVVVPISANTQYHDYTRTLGIISGATLNIGDFIIGSFRRTPTGTDTYTGEIMLKQVAAHCELDTVGSRQRYIK